MYKALQLMILAKTVGEQASLHQVDKEATRVKATDREPTSKQGIIVSRRVRISLLTSTVQVIQSPFVVSPTLLGQILLRLVNVEAANLRIFGRAILKTGDELVTNSVRLAERAFPSKTNDEIAIHRPVRI
jgi:hypothetical protein